jgi:hypothetical protein
VRDPPSLKLLRAGGPIEFPTSVGDTKEMRVRPQIAMKIKPPHGAVSLMTFGIMLLMAAGCRSSRYGARSNSDLGEAQVGNEREQIQQEEEVRELKSHWWWH